MNFRIEQAVMLVIGMLGMPLAMSGCSHAETAPHTTKAAAGQQPIVVTVAPIEQRAIQRIVPIVGTLKGYDEVTLTPKVEGRVKQLHHDVGDRVPAGELLLELDDTDFELAVSEARRTLELDLSRLGLTAVPDEHFDVNTLPSVVRAKHLVDNAQKRKARAENLRGRNVTTEQEWDQVLTDVNVAEADLQQVLLDAQSTVASTRQRQAALAVAEQKLSETKIIAPPFPSLREGGRSPTDYVVAERMASEGELVRAPDTAVMRIVMDDPLKLTGPVPERYMGEVAIDQPVKLQVEAFAGEVFDGKVSRINPTVDSASRTFVVEALVENSAHRLKAGSFAKFAIFTRVDNQARTVPLESLVTFAGVNKVFQVRDGKTHAVEVQLGVRGAGWIEVTGNLDADSPVVTSGHSQLADGSPVRIREPTASVAQKN